MKLSLPAILLVCAGLLFTGCQSAHEPGGTSHAVSPCLTTSRMAGRSETTMGRPAAMYSKSLRGDVYRSEIAVAVLGSTSRSHYASCAATAPGVTSPTIVTRSPIACAAIRCAMRAASDSTFPAALP